MKRSIIFYLILLLIVGACDDGKIYPSIPDESNGVKATLHARFVGLEAWPDSYQLVLASYGEDTEIPLMSKQISLPSSESEEVSLTLNGLSENTKTIAISILTKGRKLIYNIYTYDIGDTTDDILLPISLIDVASYERIQSQVFNNYCTACHGATEHAAANLYLTAGKSHSSLVNIKSSLSLTGEMLVDPEEANKSFLVKILEEDIINYNHTDVLPEAELIQLIETWINNGAKGIDN